MPCFRPLHGYFARQLNPSGKRSIVFNIREAQDDQVVHLPCGQCVGCRLEHSRQWAMRCWHESKAYDQNCFITLTYAPEHLPRGGTLQPGDAVGFMKRLREKHGPGIRSYGCAEYGEKFARPHYHICLFNFDWKDKVKVKEKEHGFALYESKELERLWGKGTCKTADFSFETAAYVARYVTKKVTGKKVKDGQGNVIAENPNVIAHYEAIDSTTGECLARGVERAICVSRRPGLGKEWWEKNQKRLLDQDTVIVREKEIRPPRYYDYLNEKINPERMTEIKEKRKIEGDKNRITIQRENTKNMKEWREKQKEKEEKTKEINLESMPRTRQSVMEEVAERNQKEQKRKYENGQT